jgi:hypothetical protein
MGVKAVHPCDFAEAQKHTGYLVGGTSPFGTRTHLHVYAERTIFDLPVIYINGGKRGGHRDSWNQSLHDTLLFRPRPSGGAGSCSVRCHRRELQGVCRVRLDAAGTTRWPLDRRQRPSALGTLSV